MTRLDTPSATRPATVLLVGGGGHALVVADALHGSGARMLGFLDDDGDAALGRSGRAPRLGGIDDLARIAAAHAIDGVHVAVGDNARRAEWTERVVRAGLTVVGVRSPSAVVSSGAVVGHGAYLGARASVGPEARLGAGVIVNTGAIVEHECTIDDHAHVAPGAVLGGAVRIGARALIGLNATVLPGIRIGAGAIVGAGAVALRDVPAGATVVGAGRIASLRSGAT